MTQLYWQVYKNLEKEFLGLSEMIHIDDSQQNVYSMKIADLLVRTVIEIEAISKELYLENSGTSIPDNQMYFDTVCIDHLNNLWNLETKVVLVVSPNIYFDKDENKVLRPLQKAMNRGSKSSDWNIAYQAVKHNRVKEIRKGNIKHLLHGLAALYLLNQYYKNERIDNILPLKLPSIDGSFGSQLFSVKIHWVDGVFLDGHYEKQSNYDECVYLANHESNMKEKIVNILTELTNRDDKFQNIKQASKKESSYQSAIDKTKRDFLFRLTQMDNNELMKLLTDSFDDLRYEIYLNKQQY